MDTTRYMVNAKNSVKQLTNQETFLIQGKYFNVEIKHTYRGLDEHTGSHTWCLYIIIGTEHRKSRRARARKKTVIIGGMITLNFVMWYIGKNLYYQRRHTNDNVNVWWKNL